MTTCSELTSTKQNVGRSIKVVRCVATSALFLGILGLGAWTRAQGITERGILAHDSADIFCRICARLDGTEPLGVPRFQPFAEYLYAFGMQILGRHDYAPLVVNVFCDIANTSFLFFLARRLLKNTVAAFACMGLYAVMWGPIVLSRELTTHPVATFLVMASFWYLLNYIDNADYRGKKSPLAWLCFAGFFFGLAMASHMSMQFLFCSFLVLIAMNTITIQEKHFGGTVATCALHVAVFSICAFLVISILVGVEVHQRGLDAVTADFRSLRNLRASSKWVLERHYVPRVNASRIRPTISAGTLDHLTLGTEYMVNKSRAMGNLTSYWYGDNPYSLAFILNIPLIIFLSRRRQDNFLPGYALYIIPISLFAGLYASYTAFYPHHFRYLLPVMPFLTINVFFWILLLVRCASFRRYEYGFVVAVTLLCCFGQKITLPGDAEILEITPCRQIANALHAHNVGPASQLLVVHPYYRFGTGELGWTLKRIYLGDNAVVALPASTDVISLKTALQTQNVRYLFTDKRGIDDLYNRIFSSGNPDGHNSHNDNIRKPATKQIAVVGSKELEGILYEIY